MGLFGRKDLPMMLRYDAAHLRRQAKAEDAFNYKGAGDHYRRDAARLEEKARKAERRSRRAQ